MPKEEVEHRLVMTASVPDRLRRFWATNEKANNSSCQPAREVLLTESSFREKLDKKLTAQEREFLKDADAELLKRLVAGCLADAKGQKEQHEDNKNLLRRVGNNTVVFVNNFSGFLQAYSGIVEVMKGADNQYGGLAYSTLSLLLIVGVNKKTKEERIDATLLTLQREFSRLKILGEIHSTENMKSYIADAYRLGIQFSREATLYYSRPTYRRVLEAITKPPQVAIDQKVSAITDAMTQIEKERDTLDSQRLYDVQRDVNQVQGDLEIVDGKIEAVHVQNERKLLGRLKVRLLPEGHDNHRALEEYSSVLQNTFRNLQRISSLNPEQLTQEDEFRNWETLNRSSLMVLYGKTAVTRTDLSWLSPMIPYLIDHYRSMEQMVAFHLCQDQTFMEPDTPAHAVMSNIIYQLIAAKPTILRNQSRYQEIYESVSDPRWRVSRPKMAFALLAELLSEYTGMFILLDRIDRIKGDLDQFMDSLAKLVKESKCKVKILVVASSTGYELPEGKLGPDVLEGLQYQLGPDRFSSILLNQK